MKFIVAKLEQAFIKLFGQKGIQRFLENSSQSDDLPVLMDIAGLPIALKLNARSNPNNIE